MSDNGKQKKKLASGGARLIAKGKIPVTLGLTKDQAAVIDAAVKETGVGARTRFLVHHGMRAAERILAEKENRA